MAPPTLSAQSKSSTEAPSVASFYNYGPPETDGYVGSLVGESSISECSTRSTPRSEEGAPIYSPDSLRPSRARGVSRQNRLLNDIRSVHQDCESTPLSCDPPLGYSLVARRPVGYPCKHTGPAPGPKHVRFNPHAVAIWPTQGPDPIYEVLRFGDDPDIWTAFLAAGADKSGLLGPNELRAALVNSPWNKPFEPATIDMLINIFDLNHNKAIGFQEVRIRPRGLLDPTDWKSTQFVGLSKYLKEWRNEFEKADRNQSGSIDARELKRALAQFGYKLPLKIAKMLHHRHARAGRSDHQDGDNGMTFDQFIRACVTVQNLVRTFEQFNGPRNRQRRSNLEKFVLAAISTLCG
ncbi:EF-hand [Coprinellus micaceus]|uniref:EF-hand n=1 Tax=Coprinellus micaceus TaxID=71717 RepID=A0A4Y7SNS1_COPMI|nr:EF-hand [Coprinellus micaceus]